MEAHQAPLSLGFSGKNNWSGLPFPSPMHESEKWKWSHSVVSNSQWPHWLHPTRLLHPWDFPGKSTGVGCHCLLQSKALSSFFCLLLFVFKNTNYFLHYHIPLNIYPRAGLKIQFIFSISVLRLIWISFSIVRGEIKAKTKFLTSPSTTVPSQVFSNSVVFRPPVTPWLKPKL